MKRIAAVVINDLGDMLPYTCDTTMQQCDESAAERFGEEAWEQMKKLGAKVVQVEITTLHENE